MVDGVEEFSNINLQVVAFIFIVYQVAFELSTAGMSSFSLTAGIRLINEPCFNNWPDNIQQSVLYNAIFNMWRLDQPCFWFMDIE